MDAERRPGIKFKSPHGVNKSPHGVNKRAETADKGRCVAHARERRRSSTPKPKQDKRTTSPKPTPQESAFAADDEDADLPEIVDSDDEDEDTPHRDTARAADDGDSDSEEAEHTHKAILDSPCSCVIFEGEQDGGLRKEINSNWNCKARGSYDVPWNWQTAHLDNIGDGRDTRLDLSEVYHIPTASHNLFGAHVFTSNGV